MLRDLDAMPELSTRAGGLIATRVERETQVRGDFVMSGRG